MMRARAFTTYGDAAAAARAAELVRRGRKVRFTVEIDTAGQISHIVAGDADPYAEGWHRYHEHPKQWLRMVMAGGMTVAALWWMLKKGVFGPEGKAAMSGPGSGSAPKGPTVEETAPAGPDVAKNG
jgi:hypothetical protein